MKKREIRTFIFFVTGILILVSLLKKGIGVGKVGEYLYLSLFSFLGYVSYILPILFFYYGLRYVLKESFGNLKLELIGISFLYFYVSCWKNRGIYSWIFNSFSWNKFFF